MSQCARALRIQLSLLRLDVNRSSSLWHAAVKQTHYDERYSMMNQSSGWTGWVGGGMWLWGAICILVVVLLLRLIAKLAKK